MSRVPEIILVFKNTAFPLRIPSCSSFRLSMTVWLSWVSGGDVCHAAGLKAACLDLETGPTSWDTDFGLRERKTPIQDSKFEKRKRISFKNQPSLWAIHYDGLWWFSALKYRFKTVFRYEIKSTRFKTVFRYETKRQIPLRCVLRSFSRAKYDPNFRIIENWKSIT